MNKIFYFLMVFFAFSAVQVGASPQDGKGHEPGHGFKVDGAYMMGDAEAICPEGGCDSARGTEKSREMKGDLDSYGAPVAETLMAPLDGTGSHGTGVPAHKNDLGLETAPCGAGQIRTPGVGCRDM